VNALLETYLYARVHLPEASQLPVLWEAGADDHSLRWTAAGVEAVLPTWGVELLRARGLPVEVLIPDMSAYYAERLRLSSAPAISESDPRQFRLGSMGGFYRLQEIWEEFARMQQYFPQAVGGPDTLGFSVEGRPILGYRFSLADNPSSVPAVLYTALHHAREPGGATTLVYFLWWLLEHAASGDPEANYLLRHRLLYVVPVVNPDGYAYNEARNPDGGGMWRKNRRPNTDGSFGVDLNRNYGPPAFWDAPNNGSSLNPRAETYRGSAPFSEPETQAIRDLCLRYAFRLALNYHTYSNLLIYPYSALEAETPDSTLYRLFCVDATRWNLYSCGRDIQTVGYTARGVSDDWMYDTSDGKPKIVALTPEVGTILDGFWPPAERIVEHARENLWLNLQTAWSAAANVRPLLFTVRWDTVPAVSIRFCNIGVEPSEETSVLVHPLQSGVAIRDSIQLLPRLAPAACHEVTWHLSPAPSWRNGDSLSLEVGVFVDGIPRRDTLRFRWGLPSVIPLFTSARDVQAWELTGWSAVYDSTLGSWALVSRQGSEKYPDSASLVAMLRTPLHIPLGSAATLEFWARWSIEANFDVATVEISTDGGNSWTALRTDRMRQGLGLPGSRQEADLWGWDGNFPIWTPQRCDLSAFAGRSLLLRFRLLSDAALNFPGIAVARVRALLFPDTLLSRSESELPSGSLLLFPQPARGGQLLFIRLPSGVDGEITVRLFSALGQRVVERVCLSGAGVLAVALPAELSAGLYQVELWQSSRRWRSFCLVLP